MKSYRIEFSQGSRTLGSAVVELSGLDLNNITDFDRVRIARAIEGLGIAPGISWIKTLIYRVLVWSKLPINHEGLFAKWLCRPWRVHYEIREVEATNSLEWE